MITTYSSTQQSVAIDNYLPPFSVFHAQQVSIKVDTSSQTIVATVYALFTENRHLDENII